MMMTASKLGQTRFQVRCSWLFEFPRAMEVIESISARLVSVICDFIRRARTAVSHETAIANSQCDFSRNIICDFFAL